MARFRDRATRVATEFAVVVLGVAVALAAENWRESMSEQETANGYLVRLHEELVDGRSTIEAQLGWVEMAVAAMDTLLDLDDPSDHDIPVLVSASSVYGFVASSVVLDQTYREMLSTGALNLVSDSVIRTQIPRYFRTAERFRDNLQGQERDGLSRWALRVQGATGFPHRSLVNGSEAFDESARARVVLLLEDPEWQSTMRRTRVGLGVVGFWLGQLLDQTDVLVQALEDSGGP